MAPAPLARPVDGYLAAAATFDDYGSMSDEAAAAMAAEMQPISNPLYGERIDEVAEEIKTGKAAPGAATKPDPAVNLQDGRDNQYIDLAMFEQEAAFSAHTQQEEEVESKLGKVDEERLALLAARHRRPASRLLSCELARDHIGRGQAEAGVDARGVAHEQVQRAEHAARDKSGHHP